MSRETDLAWCAGFFDGEGHVSYHRSKPSPTGKVSPIVQCSVPQNTENIEVLEFFQSVIGFGNIEGPYPKVPRPNVTPTHKILFGKKEVEPLFELLRPYLKGDKTRDFERTIEGYKNHRPYFELQDMK